MPPGNVVARTGRALSRISTRFVPDPFVLALGLTLFVMLAGIVAVTAEPNAARGGTSTLEALWVVLDGWGSHFSNTDLLAFALQMCLVLVTGHALALSPPVQRGVLVVARVPKSPRGAAVLVAAVACVSAIVHWGLGAIVGALLAREIARHAPARGLKLHYPLLGAAAYAGLAVWHGGLSGSAPLKVAQPDHFASAVSGVVPLSETLLSPLNLAVTAALLVTIPALFYVMCPSDPEELTAPDPAAVLPLAAREPQPIEGAVDWLQETPAVGRVLGGLGVAYVVASVLGERRALDLDTVNLFFLFLGILCQGSLRHYVAAVADGAKGAGAIILQFPFYFGILGIMKVSGMIELISNGFVEVSSAGTFPLFAYISAGIVNLFVPSGGGQWAVQGEILLRAGRELGVDPGVTVMAFSYGDAWTNMLQPFWALPLLGIMGLRAKDIIGYSAMVCLLMGVVVGGVLLVRGG